VLSIAAVKRGVALGAPTAVTLLIALPAPSTADGTCSVPSRPSLCRSFYVFNRLARPQDRLPRIFRDDPPLKLVDQRSSRRVDESRIPAHRVFLLGGKRLACLVDYSEHERGGGYVCNPIRATLQGRTFLEVSCEAKPRRHRVILALALPNGVHAGTVHRVAKPAVRLRVRDNLLLADLEIPSRAYLPDRVIWRRSGRLHRFRFPADDLQVTCRG
jgi:hypothetical protein